LARSRSIGIDQHTLHAGSGDNPGQRIIGAGPDQRIDLDREQTAAPRATIKEYSESASS